MTEPPKLTFAFELHANVEPPTDIGVTPRGRRRIVPILGGRVEGPLLKGRILPGGADWQLIHDDGFSELDTRYVVQTDAGALIAVRNRGIRDAPAPIMAMLLAGEPVDPALVYFRTVPRFETAAPDLQWLVRSVFVGIGTRYPAEVVIGFWRVE